MSELAIQHFHHFQHDQQQQQQRQPWSKFVFPFWSNSSVSHSMGSSMSCFPMRRFFQSHRHDDYGGGCCLQQRYEYSDKSKAAFVEGHPSWQPTPEEFMLILENVRGVEQVDWQTSKTSQNTPGSHYSDREPTH